MESGNPKTEISEVIVNWSTEVHGKRQLTWVKTKVIISGSEEGRCWVDKCPFTKNDTRSNDEGRKSKPQV